MLSVIRSQALATAAQKGAATSPNYCPGPNPEVQRLIWRLIWSTPPSLAAVCHWSFWRRRKQERARQCHYRRHAQRARPSGQVLSVGKPNRQSYPTNLSDQQWAAQRVIPIHRVGRPCKIDLRYCPQCLLLHPSQPLFLANAAQGVPGKGKPCLLTCTEQRQQGVWESICKAIRTNET